MFLKRMHFKHVNGARYVKRLAKSLVGRRNTHESISKKNQELAIPNDGETFYKRAIIL